VGELSDHGISGSRLGLGLAEYRKMGRHSPTSNKCLVSITEFKKSFRVLFHQQIEELRNGLSGKAKGRGEAFSGYAKVPNTFFFLAVAEGFNDNAALPAQAKILKMAEGARIALGEKTDLLFLNLALKAKDPEVIQQIRQVVEGMTALVALGQSENKELLELVQATKVSSTEKTVTVNIEYPLSKVVGHLDGVSQKLKKSMAKPKRAKHAKPDTDKQAESE